MDKAERHRRWIDWVVTHLNVSSGEGALIVGRLEEAYLEGRVDMAEEALEMVGAS